MCPSSFKIKVIRFPEQLEHWHFVQKFLELRKRTFVDRLRWSLDAHDDVEFEQYDSFDATYIIAHCDDQVVGGARLIRTDFSNSGVVGKFRYSYMMRDAFLGLLPEIPKDLCYKEPPRDSSVWELTRFVSTGDRDVAQSLLNAVENFLAGVGAKECLFLGPPAFLRVAKRNGFPPIPLGDIVENRNGKFLAFKCEFAK